jgi:hypothetical protein
MLLLQLLNADSQHNPRMNYHPLHCFLLLNNIHQQHSQFVVHRRLYIQHRLLYYRYPQRSIDCLHNHLNQVYLLYMPLNKQQTIRHLDKQYIYL